jgi:hypothetical protein
MAGAAQSCLSQVAGQASSSCFQHAAAPFFLTTPIIRPRSARCVIAALFP